MPEQKPYVYGEYQQPKQNSRRRMGFIALIAGGAVIGAAALLNTDTSHHNKPTVKPTPAATQSSGDGVYGSVCQFGDMNFTDFLNKRDAKAALGDYGAAAQNQVLADGRRELDAYAGSHTEPGVLEIDVTYNSNTDLFAAEEYELKGGKILAAEFNMNVTQFTVVMSPEPKYGDSMDVSIDFQPACGQQVLSPVSPSPSSVNTWLPPLT